MLVIVVDYGSGNLRSVAKALEKANSDNSLKYKIQISSDPHLIKKAEKIVLPGQGSFKDCKEGLLKIPGLIEELNEYVLIKKKTNLWYLCRHATICKLWSRRRKNRRIKLD